MVATGSVNAVSSVPTVNSLQRNKLLMTFQALITGPTGKSMPARILLDSGADLSSVTTRVAKHLQLIPTEPVSVGAWGNSENQICQSADFTINTMEKSDWQLTMSAVITERITGLQPRQDATIVRETAEAQGWKLADPKFDQPGRIDVLLGADVLPYVQKHKSPVDSIMSVETVFGHALMGTYPDKGPLKPRQGNIHIVTDESLINETADETLNATLSRFWILEEPLQSAPAFTPEEVRVTTEYAQTHAFLASEGRYQVNLPRKVSPLPLEDSRETAIRRYYSNEKSLLKKGQWHQFQKVVQEYLDLEHARPVTEAELLLPAENIFYLPMHGVHKSTSTTTKLRVVFDASSKCTNGISLNDTLAVGPMLHPPLEQILLKFRTHRVALSGDISKMYREILLSPPDQQYHRFLWRSQVEQPVREYCMRRVTFGVASSPYLAVQTLQQAAHDFGKDYPEAQKHIKESFYVDDLLGGADSEEGALELYHQLVSILSQAGFNLRKFRSSSAHVLNEIPEDLIEPMPNKEWVDCHSANYPKALGIIWDSEKDTMSTDVMQNSTYVSTKRGILSNVSKTFDVLGWITPVVFPMKLLLQQLWRSKKDWDDPIDEDLELRHKIWREELPLLKDISLPRCYFSQEPTLSTCLHGFSDASEKGFSAVVYFRATYRNSPPTSRLVVAKSRVAPKNSRSVPELELCGAVLLTELLGTVMKTLSISLENVMAWSDSTIVLCWLTKCPSLYKTFVANRLTTITSVVPASNWHHVPTNENPADCASRGLSAGELKEHHLWWSGAPWLLSEPLIMPPQPQKGELDKHKNSGAKAHTCLAVSGFPAIWLANRFS